VEADPLRSRATDALGLQRVADGLADRLLPGLSVLTRRARYFSFLCWARNETGQGYNERAIHRWEVALALTEQGLSEGSAEHSAECNFVGSRNVVRVVPKDRVPSDPRTVYKTPAWRAYRPAMIALGLVDEGSGFGLTDIGSAASSAFWKAVHPRTKPIQPLPIAACLSHVSPEERRLLREALGFSLRGELDLESGVPKVRRAAFIREVRGKFDRLSPETVLPQYEDGRSPRLVEPARTLRAAAVWEWLCLGLNALFIAWVRAIQAGPRSALEHTVTDLLSGQWTRPALGQIVLTDPDQEPAVGSAIAALRHAIRLHDRIADCELMLNDEEAFEIARTLIGSGQSKRVRVERTFQKLLGRHCSAKGDEAWVQPGLSGKLELARDAGQGWTVPSVARLHPYRMDAFDQLARDLGGI
jgi:hypothetical protein